MPEVRADRTTEYGLLALMMTKVDTENWSVPFHNMLRLDAALAGLADAPRDGVVPLVAPAAGPTVAISTTPGALPAYQTWEIAQTFVDEYGRETEAGPVSTVSTGTGVTDPDTAATIGDVVPNGSTGYEGGLLEVWYSWTDGNGGETLASPVVTTDVPYLAGGLKSSVAVILPSDAATAGAAGANIYLRHRGGNIVQAYQVLVDDVDTVTLVGAVANCYLALPLGNTTDSAHAIDVTGEAPVGTAAATTRFYLRPQGETWTTGDRRLRLSSVDEWDPATVTYPLVFTGLTAELAPGYPPTVSQVKAIRPTDLTTEAIGTLDETNVDAELARDAEIAALLGGPYVVSGLAVTAQASPDMTVKTSAGWCLSDARIWYCAADTSIAIATADATNPRIDLVCVNSAGAVVSSGEDATLKGTAAGSPAAPATPSHYVLLAEVSVPANDTTISSGQITDAREQGLTVPGIIDRLLSVADQTDLTDGGVTSLHSHPGGIAFPFPGPLEAGDEITIILPAARTVVSPYGKMYAKTVPVGADLVIDIKLNGTSIYATSTTNRPKVADGDADGWGAVGAPDTVALGQYDRLTAVVLSIGSTTAGSDVTLTLTTG